MAVPSRGEGCEGDFLGCSAGCARMRESEVFRRAGQGGTRDSDGLGGWGGDQMMDGLGGSRCAGDACFGALCWGDRTKPEERREVMPRIHAFSSGGAPFQNDIDVLSGSAAPHQPAQLTHVPKATPGASAQLVSPAGSSGSESLGSESKPALAHTRRGWARRGPTGFRLHSELLGGSCGRRGPLWLCSLYI